MKDDETIIEPKVDKSEDDNEYNKNYSSMTVVDSDDENLFKIILLMY